MSDTETVEPGTTEEQAQAVAAMEPAKEKAVRVDPTKPCLCSYFEVSDPADETGDSTFTTGCEQTTKRTFAQGHDARLVSFLVDYKLDGYEISFIKDGVKQGFNTPADAAALGSEALQVKAAKAYENGLAKIAAKKAKADDRETIKAAKAAEKAAKKEAAEKLKAEKAAAPKDDKVKVVEGSQEGDAPVAARASKIKVGRYEFDAEIDAEGAATFTDRGGNVQTIERDGYRLLG